MQTPKRKKTGILASESTTTHGSEPIHITDQGAISQRELLQCTTFLQNQVNQNKKM